MCVRDADDQCVLQFTLRNAAGCALHRRASRVIHRSELSVASTGRRWVCIARSARGGRAGANASLALVRASVGLGFGDDALWLGVSPDLNASRGIRETTVLTANAHCGLTGATATALRARARPYPRPRRVQNPTEFESRARPHRTQATRTSYMRSNSRVPPHTRRVPSSHASGRQAAPDESDQ